MCSAAARQAHLRFRSRRCRDRSGMRPALRRRRWRCSSLCADRPADLQCGAAGGTRCGLILGRSAKGADFAAMLAPGSRRETRCTHLRSLRSDNRGELDERSALCAPTPALRFSPPHKSPTPGTTHRAAVLVVFVENRHGGAGKAGGGWRRQRHMRRRGAQGSWPRAQARFVFILVAIVRAQRTQ